MITLDGRIVRELDEGRIGDPTVTADARWALYWRNDEGSEENGALYRARLDGKGSPARLTNGGDGEDGDPTVSPDGTQLAFSRGSGGGRNVMTAPWDGKALTGNPKAWTDGGINQDPSWSRTACSSAYKRGPGGTAACSCWNWPPVTPGGRSRTPRTTPCRPGHPALGLRRLPG